MNMKMQAIFVFPPMPTNWRRQGMRDETTRRSSAQSHGPNAAPDKSLEAMVVGLSSAFPSPPSRLPGDPPEYTCVEVQSTRATTPTAATGTTATSRRGSVLDCATTRGTPEHVAAAAPDPVNHPIAEAAVGWVGFDDAAKVRIFFKYLVGLAYLNCMNLFG